MSDTSFLDLPPELMMLILKNVDVLTLFNLADLYPQIKDLVKAKTFNEYFNLSGLYDLQSKHFKKGSLLRTFRPEAITTLNINSVYWISQMKLILFIQKLTNLRCLYAIDTNLNLTGDTFPLFNFNLLHLKKLSISFKNFIHYPTMGVLGTRLEKLCLYGNMTDNDLYLLMEHVGELTEIWLAYPSYKEYLSITPFPETVKKSVISFSPSFLNVSEEFWKENGTLTFFNSSGEASFERPYDERYLKIYQSNMKFDNLWDTLVGIHFFPFCKEDSRKMVIDCIKPSDIKLKELNLNHFKCYNNECYTRLRSILLSDNTKFVTKLAINFCLCIESVIPDESVEPLFKKPRIGLPNKGFTKSLLEEIVDHMPLLEVLEIWVCDLILQKGRVTNNSLSSIQKLKYLRNLSLFGIPVYIDGQFLSTIAQSCKNLTRLKIRSSGLTLAVSKALPYMKNLKDLSFRQHDINFELLLKTLLTTKDVKLERIYLSFETFSMVREELLDAYFKNNNQLIFFGIIFQSRRYDLKMFHRIFDKYRAPHRVFTALEKVYNRNRQWTPLVHLNELVRRCTEVSVIDFFNDFIKA